MLLLVLEPTALDITQRDAAGSLAACGRLETGEELTAAPPAGWGHKQKKSLQQHREKSLQLFRLAEFDKGKSRFKKITTLGWVTQFETRIAPEDRNGYAKLLV